MKPTELRLATIFFLNFIVFILDYYLQLIIFNNLTFFYKRIVIINGVAELVDKLFLNPEEVAFLLNGGNDYLQLLFIDSLTKVGNTYGGLTDMVKESMYQLLFGGSLQNQLFIENLPYTQKNIVVPRNVLHSLKDDLFEDIVIPMEVGE